jgi:hypothetical protein
MDAVIQRATISMLGLPDPTIPPPAQDPSYFAVRCGWQQQGQPFQKISEDVTYLRCAEVDDQYDRIRDVSYLQSPQTFIKVTNYTRVWEIFWTVYGPNSFDNARKLRTRLFDQDIHDQLAASQLYLVTDPAAPRRVPELEDGQWWERVDFSAKFNEFVTEQYVTEYAQVSEIILENELGILISTIPVEEPS